MVQTTLRIVLGPQFDYLLRTILPALLSNLLPAWA